MRPGGANLKAGASGTTAVGSFNWSGYADSSATPNTFTAVSAKWRQPGTVCSPEQELTAYWVGLDGYSNETVKEDGTFVDCFEGGAHDYTWWEMYPGGSVTVGSTVQPGDVISASVKRSGTWYTLSLTDFNNPANSFSTVQSCTTCQNESAEWIAERPAFSIGITPLTFFRTWNPVRAVQTSNGARGTIAAGPNPTQITMFDATQTYPLDSVLGCSPPRLQLRGALAQTATDRSISQDRGGPCKTRPATIPAVWPTARTVMTTMEPPTTKEKPDAHARPRKFSSTMPRRSALATWARRSSPTMPTTRS